MEQSSDNQKENKIIVYDLTTDTQSLRYIRKNEAKTVIDCPNNEEIVIDTTNCTSASGVMFYLTQDKQNFQQDEKK